MARAVGGRAACPVCGRGYRGELVDHLDRPARSGVDFTRCDERLYQERVERVPLRMRAAGWVLAGPTAARVAAALAATHPHLARLTSSGTWNYGLGLTDLSPDADQTAWWTRPWCRVVATVPRWRLSHRQQVIIELDGQLDVHALIVAAHAAGGPEAVAALEGGPVAPRCAAPQARPAHEPESRPRAPVKGPWDACVLADRHAGQHLGGRHGYRYP